MIKSTGINFEFVDLGGGFGIPYNKNDKIIDIKNYAKLVQTFKNKLNCKIIFEPGRFIIGDTGILISKVVFL